MKPRRRCLGERGLHELAQRGALAWVDPGDRLAEVGASLPGVVALGGAGPEDRPCGRPVLGLVEELLVGTLLELLNRPEGPDLVLHPALPLLRHAREVWQTARGNPRGRERPEIAE